MLRRALGTVLLAAILAPQQGLAQLKSMAQLRGTDGGNVPLYHAKPSEVPVPPGAKPGSVRRLIQPFGTWTQICDENLKARTRLCNVSQTFVDEAGALVFSWSLAGTSGGAPVFILRAPVADQADRAILLGIGKAGTRVPLQNCDAHLCLGFLPLGPEIRRAIDAGAEIGVQRANAPGKPDIALRAPLAGLAAAIASIK